jgi:hypothetical protein
VIVAEHPDPGDEIDGAQRIDLREELLLGQP